MESRYKQKEKERKLQRRKENKGKIVKRIAILLTIALFICLWGRCIEPYILSINDYKIENKDIPESFEGIRIVHFSDLHYGKGFSEYRLNKLIKNINSLKPDIVVFTGDLIDKHYKISDSDIKLLVDNLKKIKANLGKYAVIGNHDTEFQEYDDIIYDSDFRLLKNNYDIIYNNDSKPILVYGLDNITNGNPKIKGLKRKSVKNIPYKIVIMHEPDYINEFIYDYDINLVLAGHSHNGQVNIPGLKKLYLPKGSRNYYKDHYTVNDAEVYISNGVGNSFIDFRLGTMPSINIYRLYTK